MTGELNVSGDGDFEADDVGFTVYRGHPYCEACHVRLRLPKCKACKRSIRDGDEAVEALGGKWCWKCFVCAVSVSFCLPFPLSPFFLKWCWIDYADVGFLVVDRAARSLLRTRRFSREGTSRIASRVLVSFCGMRSDTLGA